MYREGSRTNHNKPGKSIRRSLKRRRALIICLVITLFVCYASFDVSANSNKNNNQEALSKVFVTYEVKSGDNLWSIAKECCNISYYTSYEKYIDEVVAINHIKGGKIYAGNKLTIPEYV